MANTPNINLHLYDVQGSYTPYDKVPPEKGHHTPKYNKRCFVLARSLESAAKLWRDSLDPQDVNVEIHQIIKRNDRSVSLIIEGV